MLAASMSTSVKPIFGRCGPRSSLISICVLVFASSLVNAATITTKTVYSADGTPIFAQAMGQSSPTTPQLLYVHGNSITSLVWDHQFYDPAMQEELYQVRFDLRGMGQSGMPTMYANGSVDVSFFDGKRQAEDLEAVIKAFGMTKPVVLGWSFGGNVVANYIEYNSMDSFAGIVFTDSCVGTTEETAPYFSIPPLIYNFENVTALPADFIEAVDLFVNLVIKSDTTYDEWTILSLKGMVVSTPSSTRANLYMGGFDKFKTVASQQKPFLIFWGAEDSGINATATQYYAKFWNPALLTTHVVPGAGHMLFWEKPEYVNPVLRAWLKETWSTK